MCLPWLFPVWFCKTRSGRRPVKEFVSESVRRGNRTKSEIRFYTGERPEEHLDFGLADGTG